MYERLLVPFDGGEHALAALEHALELAADHDATVHVLYVIDTTTNPLVVSKDEVRAGLREVGEDAAGRAFAAAEERADEHGVDLTTELREGKPAVQILESVGDLDVDLIVMGTHGRSGLRRLVLGSVAEKVLRTTNVPALLVPPAATVDGVDVEYREILLPTDGSEGAETAVDWGLKLADSYDGRIHTIYSVDTGRFAGEGEVIGMYEALERTGEAALDTVRQQAREAGVDVTATLGTGSAARAIRSYSEDPDVDLIVMGPHGRSGVERYLIGSVTESVVRHAEVPVCCIPLSEA